MDKNLPVDFHKSINSQGSTLFKIEKKIPIEAIFILNTSHKSSREISFYESLLLGISFGYKSSRGLL